jgi:5-methylcytosine-specific restriction enzyme subunit McrC
MFTECLKSPVAARYMPDVYDIRINKNYIPIPTEGRNDFIPLIIYHYLYLLSRLVKKPLVKAYINTEENLKSKIKGKILISKQIKKNIANNRKGRVMCGFDEYSVDCPANRLLHSAYQYAIQYSKRYINDALLKKYDYIEGRFNGIGYIKNTLEINKIKTNPLFLEYKDALNLAKRIYSWKSYTEKHNGSESANRIPPYIIDMAKLFELYVYTKLKAVNQNIQYQSGGKYGQIDFLDIANKVFIDTKYKTIYGEESQYKNKIEDIRQISGYARDEGLLKKVYGNNKDTWNNVPVCIIIYPDRNSQDTIEGNYLASSNKIAGFYQFYKHGIKLPVFAGRPHNELSISAASKQNGQSEEQNV